MIKARLKRASDVSSLLPPATADAQSFLTRHETQLLKWLPSFPAQQVRLVKFPVDICYVITTTRYTLAQGFQRLLCISARETMKPT